MSLQVQDRRAPGPSSLSCAVGFDFRIQELSAAWESLLGVASADLRAKPFPEWLHPDDRPAALAGIGRLFNSGETVTFDARVASRERTYRSFEWSAFTFGDRNVFYAIGRPRLDPSRGGATFRMRLSEPPDGIVLLNGDSRIALVSSDTDALRPFLRADLSGRWAEILLPGSFASCGNPLELSLGPPGEDEGSGPFPAAAGGALVGSAEDAILTRTGEDRISSWNPAAERLHGFAAREVLGHPAAMLVPPERSSEDRRIFARILQGERLPPYDTERLRKDGSRIDVSISAFPLSDGSGIGTGIAEIVREISDRKRGERHLLRRADELARSNADLQDYASTLGHDLQEPLHAIVAYLEDLQKRVAGRVDDDGAELVAFALEAAQGMQTLTRDLLSCARIDLRPREFERTDANRLVEGVLTALRPQIEKAGARVAMGFLPEVRAHRSGLSQVFQNLIANALKHRGSAPPLVRIEAEQRPGEFLFRVIDNGPGMSPDRLRHLFQPRVRHDEEDARPRLGMGLAIAARIVERHGGRIWAESTPGTGSTFFFTLPAREERG